MFSVFGHVQSSFKLLGQIWLVRNVYYDRVLRGWAGPTCLSISTNALRTCIWGLKMSWNVRCSLEVEAASSHVPKFIIIFARWSRPNLQRDQHALASIRGQLRPWMHTDAINCHQAAFYQHLQTPLSTYGSPSMKGEVIAGSRPNPTEISRQKWQKVGITMSYLYMITYIYIYMIVYNYIFIYTYIW